MSETVASTNVEAEVSDHVREAVQSILAALNLEASQLRLKRHFDLAMRYVDGMRCDFKSAIRAHLRRLAGRSASPAVSA
jgi:hypothetical protein